MADNEVPEFTVNHLENDAQSDVDTPSKKIRNPFVSYAESDNLSLNDFEPNDPIEELFLRNSAVSDEATVQPVRASKKRTKIHKKARKDLQKPVKCVKRRKITESLEKNVGPDINPLEVVKDMNAQGAKSPGQKKKVKSTKNSSAGHAGNQPRDSQKAKSSDHTISPKESKRKAEDGDGNHFGSRKSMRLKKKESNLEECKGCTCKKSQCIKLYCECFLSKGFCSPACSCEDCFNMEENEEEILKIRKKITSRNPHAFQGKTKIDEDTPVEVKIDKSQSSGKSKLRHIKGCH